MVLKVVAGAEAGVGVGVGIGIVAVAVVVAVTVVGLEVGKKPSWSHISDGSVSEFWFWFWLGTKTVGKLGVDSGRENEWEWEWEGDVRVLGFAFELCAFLNLCTACLLGCIASYHIICLMHGMVLDYHANLFVFIF